jgi:hypothetical protein
MSQSNISSLSGGQVIHFNDGVTAMLDVTYQTTQGTRIGGFALRIERSGMKWCHVIQVVSRTKFLLNKGGFFVGDYISALGKRSYGDPDTPSYALDVPKQATNPFYDSFGARLREDNALTIADCPAIAPEPTPWEFRDKMVSERGDKTAFYAIDFCIVDGGLYSIVEWGRSVKHGQTPSYWVRCPERWGDLIKIGRNTLQQNHTKRAYVAEEAKLFIPERVIRTQKGE